MYGTLEGFVIGLVIALALAVQINSLREITLVETATTPRTRFMLFLSGKIGITWACYVSIVSPAFLAGAALCFAPQRIFFLTVFLVCNLACGFYVFWRSRK